MGPAICTNGKKCGLASSILSPDKDITLNPTRFLFVGQGNAPTFFSEALIHITKNINGDVTATLIKRCNDLLRAVASSDFSLCSEWSICVDSHTVGRLVTGQAMLLVNGVA